MTVFILCIVMETLGKQLFPVHVAINLTGNNTLIESLTTASAS